jgi:hypothetical protein
MRVTMKYIIRIDFRTEIESVNEPLGKMSGQTAQDVATKRTSDNLAAHNDVLAKVWPELVARV